MKATIEALSSILNRTVTDEYDVLSDYSRVEFDSITFDKEFEASKGLNTQLVAIVSKGKGRFNTLHAGEEVRITLLDNDVYEVE